MIKNDSGLPVFIPSENDLIQSHGEMCSQIEIIQLIDGNNFIFQSQKSAYSGGNGFCIFYPVREREAGCVSWSPNCGTSQKVSGDKPADPPPRPLQKLQQMLTLKAAFAPPKPPC